MVQMIAHTSLLYYYVALEGPTLAVVKALSKAGFVTLTIFDG